MNQFHSMVSRRDFMKGLGLAGVGATALTAPTFHDLDELTSSEAGNFKRPWWVKQVDKPTLEIDWAQVKRYDHRTMSFSTYTNAEHMGHDEWKAVVAKGADKGTRYPTTQRDQALSAGSSAWSANKYTTSAGMTGPLAAKTAEQLGFPKWSGTPEEATRMLRAAATAYGASQIGTAFLGHEERGLVWTHRREGKLGGVADNRWVDTPIPPEGYWAKIDMEDVPVGYEETFGNSGTRQVIPTHDLWDISVMVPMPKEAWKVNGGDSVSSGAISSFGNGDRYRKYHTNVQPGVQTFIKALGWTSYGYVYPDYYGGFVPAQASAIIGGVSEATRSSETISNPEYGPVTGYFSILTEFPLAPEKPIDAGMYRFCFACRKCADTCPSQAISHDAEPVWEIPRPSYYKVAPRNHSAGKKHFWTDTTACRAYTTGTADCRMCKSVCVFNKQGTAMVHEVVRGVLSTTPIFNSFFTNMDDMFGYGLITSDDWWNKAVNLPTWGIDTTVNATTGVG